MRRATLLILVVGVILALAAPAGAAKHGKVELVSEQTAAVLAGDTVWIALTWRADGDLPDFRVVVRRNDDAVVAYPANTGDHSAPHQSADLADGEIDFTSIQIHVPNSEGSRGSGRIHLQVEASWDDGGRRTTSRQNVKVPVARYEGVDVVQVTESVEVAAGSGRWVEVAYTGLAPSVERFSVVVGEPAGFSITYPGYGTETSLHHDAVLQDGETDVVRFYVDAGEALAGRYSLELLASFARGAQPDGIQSTVDLLVIPAVDATP